MSPEAYKSGWVFNLGLVLCWSEVRETRQFTLASVAFLRPPACGPIVFCIDLSSPVPRLLSLKVTPPKPRNFGFKNHFDLIFYREHGRLSEFNLPLFFNTLGVGHLLTYLTKLWKSLCLETDCSLKQNVKAGCELSMLEGATAQRVTVTQHSSGINQTVFTNSSPSIPLPEENQSRRGREIVILPVAGLLWMVCFAALL